MILISFVFALRLSQKPPLNKSDYMAAIIDKHAEAAKIKGPKIIFAGGSNLAFGLNSKEIEDKFGLPVINMSLEAGLGLDFILNELREITNAGDIVFLAIEYYMDEEGNYDLKKSVRNFYPESGKYFKSNYLKEANNYLTETEGYLKHLFDKRIKYQRGIDSFYARRFFNKYGDLTSHLKLKNFKTLGSRKIFQYKNWDGIEELNKFYEYSKDNHFSVFFQYTPYAESEYRKNYSVIKKLQNDLNNNLKMEILNKPSDFAYNDSLFFNTIYHLNKYGREERTEKLIDIFSKNGDIQNAFITAERHWVSKIAAKN